MIFNEKIRLLRKKNGLTQEKFAREIGVSRQSVYKWEDGQSYPEIDKIIKMKRLFSVSIDDLFDDGMSVSDDGTLKTNAEVEYENAHKKKRKPRKDKGIKTGIPPHRKDGTPVRRKKKLADETVLVRKKKPAKPAVEEAAPVVTPVVETPVVETPVVETPVVTPVTPTPVAPATPTPNFDERAARMAQRQPSFRNRAAAPTFADRDAQNKARQEVAARMNRADYLSDNDEGGEEDTPKNRGGFFSMFRRK